MPIGSGDELRDAGKSLTFVRNNAWSTAIAAVLMCLYGFAWLAKPTPTDLFSWCALVLYHTLRLGGVVMAIVTVWSLLGRPAVLAVDAISSTLIGVVFVSTGIGMLVDGGAVFNSVLIVLFGGLFIRSGVQNWHLFRSLGLRYEGRGAMPLAGRPEATRMSAAPAPVRAFPPLEAEAPAKTYIEPTPRSDAIQSEPTPEGGFLAAFGQKPPPPRP